MDAQEQQDRMEELQDQFNALAVRPKPDAKAKSQIRGRKNIPPPGKRCCHYRWQDVEGDNCQVLIQCLNYVTHEWYERRTTDRWYQWPRRCNSHLSKPSPMDNEGPEWLGHTDADIAGMRRARQ